jgi:hypothetical protein
VIASFEMRLIGVMVIAACGRGGSPGTLASLRAACEPTTYWNGTACTPRGDGAKNIAAGVAALVEQDVDKAKIALDAAERAGHLDHQSNITLWEQRGIAAGFVEDQKTAERYFDTLLAIDPTHYLPGGFKPAVLRPFERMRDEMKKAGATALDVNWPNGLKTGESIPLEVEVLVDPKGFLRRATVFVREHGETTWRAADVPLSRVPSKVKLPAVQSTKATSLELYLRAYDDKGNEVLAWADPKRPREIPLRYDPPPKWYRSWKTYAIGGTAAALVTGIIVYAVTLSPPDTAPGTGAVR